MFHATSLTTCFTPTGLASAAPPVQQVSLKTNASEINVRTKRYGLCKSGIAERPFSQQIISDKTIFDNFLILYDMINALSHYVFISDTLGGRASPVSYCVGLTC